MSLVKVEILVSGIERLNPSATQLYDIITIQPAGTLWGNGDLTGKFVFCVELDLPCGLEWKKSIRCSQCEHYGIDWETTDPVEGTKGTGRTTCDIIKYEQANIEYTFHVDFQGYPRIEKKLIHKSSGKIDFSKIASLFLDTISKVQLEYGEDLISLEERDARLANARKPSNEIPKTFVVNK